MAAPIHLFWAPIILSVSDAGDWTLLWAFTMLSSDCPWSEELSMPFLKIPNPKLSNDLMIDQNNFWGCICHGKGTYLFIFPIFWPIPDSFINDL